jgi:hypothetical protein
MADLNVSGSVIATQNVQAGNSVFANNNIGVNGTVYAGTSVIASANLQAGRNVYASVDAIGGRSTGSTGLPITVPGTTATLTVLQDIPTTVPSTQPGLLLTAASGNKYILYVTETGLPAVPTLHLTRVTGY